MFAFTLVTDHTFVLSTPVIKGLHSQRTSSLISWHMLKEGSKMLFSTTLTNLCTDFQGWNFIEFITGSGGLGSARLC